MAYSLLLALIILIVLIAALGALLAIGLRLYQKRTKAQEDKPEELDAEQADEITTTWHLLNH